ncbi:MAG: START domain-containing protein [Venatoribacter sp.]
MKRISLAISLALSVFAFSSFAEQGEWEFVHSKDGIDTYRMRHEGTEVQTFKGVGFVDAKVEVIGEVMRDIENYPKWMAKFKKTKILKKIDRNSYIFTAVVKTPFPYQNRDLVIANSTEYNFSNGTAVLKFWSDNEFDYPHQKGLFRLNAIEGEYLFEYFGRDKTRVTYQYRSDPGGNIPVAVANEVEIKNYPLHTLQGLRKIVKEEKYIQAGANSEEFTMIEKMVNNKADVERILKNRIGEYIIDSTLLDMMFSLPLADNIVERVYQSHSNFVEIKQSMVDLFNLLSAMDKNAELKPKVQPLLNYIEDKPFDSFFSMQQFMREAWLVDEISKDQSLVNNMLNTDSPLSQTLFEKITTSEVAVSTFITDKKLAARILTEPELRQKLWQDTTLREQLAEQLGQFTRLKDFEDLVRQRVSSYQAG